VIKVTRLNNSHLFLNPDLIETLEETPDTHVTLVNGRHYVVKESARVLNERIINHKASILRRASSKPLRRYLIKRHLAAFVPQELPPEDETI
jgi:flagellar protein FlbD